jgi:hypothetical protein
MNALLLALALGATALSNFPREAGGRISQPAIGVTLGGAPAVVVPAGEKVVALRGDGSMVPGFPVSLGPGEAAAGPAAAADMDGDGRPEVAVVTTSGRVFLWSGGPVPGFPLQLGARARAGASFGDVDGDGRPELLVGDEKGRVHALKRTGRELAGWPAKVPAPVTSAISSSSFGSSRAFAFGCEDGRVHVLDPSGRSRAGLPHAPKFSVTGAPAFADVDDDGEMDLVATSQDFALHVVNARGKPLPGFPVRAGYRLYESPAVADLDGDGRLDIAFASADGMIHAVSRSGEPLAGYPVRLGVRLFTGPAVGDLDRDGALDVVAVAADGTIGAFGPKGKPLAGFPSPLLGADVGASPLLYDALGEGSLAVFVGLPSGALHAVRASRVGTEPARAPWAGPGRDAARSGRYGPNAPSYKDLALTPAAPRATDTVQARWRAVWLDAGPDDAVPAPRIEWRRDGKEVPALDGRKDLPPGTVKRGERWRFVLSSPGGASWESEEVKGLDTAPGAPTVAIEPAVPTRGTDARASVTRAALDPDGDPLRYEYAWLLDGLETGVQGETFPANLLRRGALLGVRVAASDGQLSGPPALAQARVGDTAPGVARISLEPATPGRADTLRARLDAPASDEDGDPVVYRYRWTVDGQPRNLPASAALLPGALFRKHQVVEVEARAFDGQLEGPPARASVTARNTPPTAPRVEIRPARPRRGDALRASILAASEDDDGDPIAYRFEWKKNGAPFHGAVGDGREVPGAEVVRGDVFELTVTPHDGEAGGPTAAATVAVGNTPPAPPRIALEPVRPKGGEPLRIVVLEPARDVDGERVSHVVAWTREGKPTGAGLETLPPSEFRKHERVRVVLTPRDGEDAGDPVAYEVVVDDAPPTAPVVAFASEKPTVTAPLKVLVKTPATDPDGDEVRYQYRWIRDGAAVVPSGGAGDGPSWTMSSEVPARELRKGQRWTVEVRAHDGEKPGPVARATTTIVNSPPPAPRLAFVPERPRRVDGIAVSIEQAPDPDGDVLTYRYSWTRDGQRHEAPADQAQIPRGVARKGQRWAVEVVASDGEAESEAVRHHAVVADTAPGPTAVALCDGPIPAGTVPQARIAHPSADADGDAVAYRHDWTVNGRPVPSAQGQARLAAPALRKHDRVRVVVTPWDGELAGPPAMGECEVENTPPTAPALALDPAEPTAPRGVSVTIRKPSGDRDGDDITYRYVWYRDGVQTAYDKAAIPPGVLRHRETWRVEVTPFDGEETGERVTASAVVKNTPPAAPTVVLVPDVPAAGEPVVCDARAPERDADLEAVSVRYRWTLDGRPVAIGEASAALAGKIVRRGERWRCEAWSFDGTAESPRASAELTVRNSAPSAPTLAIEPEAPRRGSDLFCRVETPSTDADDDPVEYAYAWTRNGRPVPPGPDPARVDGTKVAKGERWRCTATASDGAARGAPASAERTIANTPPGPATIRLQPAAPRAGQPVRCEIASRSEDVDRDAVRYRFSWQRNGVGQPFAASSQEVPPRLVKAGDRWRCLVTPTDGSEDGPPAGSEELLVLPGEQGVTQPVSDRPRGRAIR